MSSEAKSEGCRQGNLLYDSSGQVIVEACIGMALFVFAWSLISYVTYMGNNHIRTAMAARHASWMQGHNVSPTDATLANFFFGADAAYAHVTSEPLHLSVVGVSSGRTEPTAHRIVVTFGMTPDELANTEALPFAYMKTHVPFMPETRLESFLSVQSSNAWPADVPNTWQSRPEALKGVIREILNTASGALRWLGGLFS